ncbi:hypothetical protein F3C99_04265 [Vitellibacter sp. q18]|nr:hypothetical protein [Aequorivita lutea]
MRGLARNFASTHQTENPRGFSEVGDNKQLLIAIVGSSFYMFNRSFVVSISISISFSNSKVLFTKLSNVFLADLK